MQLCVVRSCGVSGFGRLAKEVGRRADDRHAHVRPDAHGDHALGHGLAGPHARVVALGHDVGQAVVDGDLHPDVRVVRQEPLQGGPEDGSGRVLGGRDADGAGGLLAHLAEGGHLRLDLVQPRPHGSEQAFARLGGGDAAGGAGQEPQPEPRLQPAEGLAQC